MDVELCPGNERDQAVQGREGERELQKVWAGGADRMDFYHSCWVRAAVVP